MRNSRMRNKMLDVTAMCAAVLAMSSAIELIIGGISKDVVASLVVHAGFFVVSVAGWRCGVCLWMGISLGIVAAFGMEVPYYYIILLFFIDISKSNRQRIFILYLLIALAMGVSGNIGVLFMVEQMTMMGGILYLFGNRRKQHTTLVLTNDEEHILSELATGKQQKEIRRWTKNTVSKKLKQARERNGCLSNAELLLLYREKSGLFPANADQSHIPAGE